jgi:hypothetical protein
MSSKASNANSGSLVGCLYFVGIILALAFWQVTLILLVIGAIYYTYVYTRKNARTIVVKDWIKFIGTLLVALMVSSG